MIYPPTPIWSIDPGIIAYNCKKSGMPHPVLAMPMWEGAGDRVIDYSGRGHHGTNEGADWVADGLDFVNADNDYIGISDSSILATLTASSIVMQIKSNTNGGNNGKALYCERTSSIPIFKLEIKQNAYSLRFTHRDNSSVLTQIDSINDVSDGNLNTVVLTKAGTDIKMYINGELNKSGALNGGDVLTAGNVRIGRDAYSSVSTITSVIYNTSTYSCTLTAAQVKFLHENPYFMYQIPEELYGYVAGAPPVGWTGEIIGITNPTEILGRATSGITEVMGISSS